MLTERAIDLMDPGRDLVLADLGSSAALQV